MSILLKTNLFRTKFPKFCSFWSTWWKSVPKKFSLQGLFAKIHTCKETFSNWFANINKGLVTLIHIYFHI